MKVFYEPIRELAGYESISKCLGEQGNTVMLSGCIDSEKVHMVQALGDSAFCRVILTYDETKAREMVDDCRFFNRNTLFYPAKDLIFYSADVRSNELVAERMKAIKAILENTGNLTIVTTIDGCADMLLAREKIESSVLCFEEGGIVDLNDLKKKLVLLGYENMGQVQAPGEFGVRGGIIDIFPLTEEAPVRIELWDDEIDSIRSFDVESQRSIERLEKVTVYPATEYVFTQSEIDNGLIAIAEEAKKQAEIFAGKDDKREELSRIKHIPDDFNETTDIDKFVHSFTKTTVSFIEYFDRENTLFVLDEPNRIVEKMNLVEFEFEDSIKNRLEKGYILPSQADVIYTCKEIYAKLNSRKLLVLSTLDYKPKELDISQRFKVDSKSISSYNNRFEYLVADLKKYKKAGYRVVIISNSRTRASRMVDDLRDNGIDSHFSENFDKALVDGEIMVTYGNLHKGFEYPILKFVVIAESDIFGQEKKEKKRKKRYNGKAIADFNELAAGDYVVHENYGLGVYRGIEKIAVEGIERDYIKIEYSGNDALYILATQLDMLQKYAGADARKPKLNKLGGQEWSKTKSKVKTAVTQVAKDLVELYAKRQSEQGFQFSEDTVWQREFEEMFPYEETLDQISAIADTKHDMESPKIMDRLICGDVGYGKTEIAIRAAFKAVQDGKQVAYLVPTTILAQQHFNTFEQRMKDFPVKVAMLSRFRTAKEIKQTLTDLKKGMVDIVIGTHRLLSKDVEYKDLGLLIIDEEQRFGVSHKEKIKKLKENIDVLTLSATPIPRTLHMSLVGIRDMSVLEEPPVDRMPIQTFVTEHNDEMIREAINRELGRGGQVYYVYNKVRNIDEVATHIQQLVPDANVAFAHGQMDEKTLEAIMYDFINGDIDVLVSTTIIETGLDISNVNTMIIEDAENFGLSQLYQLRGRVGRSNRTAYAFLLYRRGKMLKEVAEKRLHAIREFTELGSGFKIAMKDLEIRGAGNVLGEAQHGHMAAVGYDLYCKMLNEAVCRLKGEYKGEDFETVVDLNVDAFIPATYIRSESQKLDLYKRIAAIETREEQMDMQDELIDRFGDLPHSATNLLTIALIKSVAHKADIRKIKGGLVGNSDWRVEIYFTPSASLDVSAIPEIIERNEPFLEFKPGNDPYFIYSAAHKDFPTDSAFLAALEVLAESFAEYRTI
ncbi:MAG: transcription-repair coupling factor [Clostridia bacterium]|nr:transcription-repair coupling factor [Clostridia bacterium]